MVVGAERADAFVVTPYKYGAMFIFTPYNRVIG
jgi:hypothetical protein